MQDSQIKITVITINYNNINGLRETLNSIKKNARKDVELIIIDGKSSDGSQVLIKSGVQHLNKIFGNVRVIIESDNGIYDAMNKGLKLATGRYVGFLNSGDTFASNSVLAQIIHFICAKGSPDGVYGNLNFIDDSGRVKRVWTAGNFARRKFYVGWMPPHPSTYLLRSKLMDVGIFNLEYKIAADYDLLFRFCFVSRYRLELLNSTLVNMEVGGISNGKFTDILRSNIEVCRSWKKNVGIFPVWLLVMKPLSKIRQLVISPAE